VSWAFEGNSSDDMMEFQDVIHTFTFGDSELVVSIITVVFWFWVACVATQAFN
jgi:hypothetical protein